MKNITHNLKRETELSAGNQAMRGGDYEAAAKFYRQGLDDCEPALQDTFSFNLNLAVRAGSHLNGPTKKMTRAAVFASYSEKCLIEDYVIFYLRQLKEMVEYIIFVSDNEISSEEMRKLDGIVDITFTGRHEEYDFGSYKIGFKYLKTSRKLGDFDELIFCNDSCYGPIASFSEAFLKMTKEGYDFWGLTENYQFKVHLQSYFLVFKRSVFATKEFNKFITDVTKEENVQGVILNYEVNFTEVLEGCGFKWGAYVDSSCLSTQEKLNINSNLTVFPAFLVNSGCPLIKVKAMRRANCNLDGIHKTAELIFEKNKNLYDCIDNHIGISIYRNRSNISFSVIMPTYNRAHSVCNSIDSVLSQEFKNYEIIIVDDGSTDNTAKKIRESYASELNSGYINYIKLTKNIGVAGARNIGLQAARNSWIVYCDSDNFMRPNFLDVYVDGIIEFPNHSSFYARLMRSSTMVDFGESFNYHRLTSENFIDIGVFVHHKDITHDIGYFDTRLKRLVDWEFIIRATKYIPATFLPITVMDYSDLEGAGDRISSKESFNVALAHIRKKHNLSYKISTVIVTYNHEKYLSKAIESACSQKGDFTHEIFIFDDCSTDGTWRVIQEYAKKYPDLIRGCRQEKNIGQALNFRSALGAARGDFIAVLEGDDYWTDSLKLQKQSKFLVENYDCSMVFSKIEVYDLRNDSKFFLQRQENIQKDKLDGSDFLAESTMNLIANFSSCMYRRYIFESLPLFAYAERISEISVAFHFEKFGKIGYINNPMGVYQQHENGLWTGADEESQAKMWLETRRIAKKIARDCWKDSIESIINNRIKMNNIQEKSAEIAKTMEIRI